MLDFMVIGLPRSGTTWMANLLNTDYTTCEHDPLHYHHYTEWDNHYGKIPGRVSCGISCTGIWRWTDWLNSHPSTKVIIHRNPKEVYESLGELGMDIDLTGCEKLFDIEGLHVNLEDLFSEDTIRRVWSSVTSEEFNSHRYNILKKMSIQPHFPAIHQDNLVARRLYSELEAR